MIKRKVLADGRYAVITTRRAAYVSHIFGKATIYKSKESYDKNNVLFDGYTTVTNIFLGQEQAKLNGEIEKFFSSLENK
jgi:hypothetical protein